MEACSGSLWRSLVVVCSLLVVAALGFSSAALGFSSLVSQPSGLLFAAAASQTPLAAEAQPWNLGSDGFSPSAEAARARRRAERRTKRRAAHGKGSHTTTATPPTAAEPSTRETGRSCASGPLAAALGGGRSSSACAVGGTRALVTLSVGDRPHMRILRPILETYARHVNADLHVVDTYDHEAIRSWNASVAARKRSLRHPLLAPPTPNTPSPLAHPLP